MWNQLKTFYFDAVTSESTLPHSVKLWSLHSTYFSVEEGVYKVQNETFYKVTSCRLPHAEKFYFVPKIHSTSTAVMPKIQLLPCQRFILQDYCHTQDSLYRITVLSKIYCTGLLSCQRFIVQDYCNGKDSFCYSTQSMTVETGWSFVTSCDSGKHILYAENIFFITILV